MNDKILIPWKLFYPELDYIKDNKGALISRADLEALLAKPEPPKLVRGSVCRVWDNGINFSLRTIKKHDSTGVQPFTTDNGFTWQHAEPLDWETLGYTIAQNYPEANWFAVDAEKDKQGRQELCAFVKEPAEENKYEEDFASIWTCQQGVVFRCRVTLPPGVDWRTTKRRIERI